MIYEENEGEYNYSSRGVITTSSSVWMIASTLEKGRWILLSHGPEKNVKAKYDKMIKAYIEAGLDQEVEDMYLLNASDFPLEDINKCIENSGYISTLINADIFCNKAKQLLC